MLPVLILGAVALFMRPKSARIAPIKVLFVKRWVANSAGVNDFNVNLTLQWNRSWFDRRAVIPFKSWGHILDADGKVVSTQGGFGFGHNTGSRNHYYYVFTLNTPRSSIKPWKEPLTFQSVLILDDGPPLEVNVELPPVNHQESPRASHLALLK